MVRRSVMILCVQLLLAVPPAAAAPLVWPLDLPTRYLTSNFLETRGGRFHTGIDLKTDERTGLAVRAVSDGWISRIKSEPGGYGKAVYLTDQAGRTFVYAHLERLADPLRQREHAAQSARGRYRIDLHLKPDELPVRRGEVIALSGQTATDGPHLHFEVRGPDGAPLNPRRHGFATADTIAPEILAVRLWWGSRSYRFGDGRTPLSGELPPVSLPAGDVRVSARLVERSDHLRYRLEPYQVELAVDGWGTVGAGRNDRMRWSDVRRERLVFRETDLGRERAFWAAGAGGEWRADGRDGRGPGQPDDPTGTTYTYRLTAADVAGNRSEVWWTVIVDPSGEDSLAAGWVVQAASEVAAVQPATVLDLDHATPGTAIVAGGHAEEVEVLRAPLLPSAEPTFHPLGRAIWFLPEHPFPYESLLEPLPVVVAPTTLAVDDRVGVYRHTGKEWTFTGKPSRAPQGWVVSLDHPGAYLVGRDDEPPSITGPRRRAVPAGRLDTLHGISLPRWQRLAIAVADRASGIDWDRSEVRLDGVLLVAEPDPPRGRLLIEFPDTTPAGVRQLDVSVSDRAGLVARASLSLEFTDGPP